ncbi:hypothetical protein BpHYR1_002737 [Brachionus plicatilis]|uniref:Uncharacterized protein n=1 Tax=Brachionus plicatilis TaxID=10195 RepID=A0A3M7Q0A1_BRAPC|nr:hypothetical protein BpHYR1_002737 [Brachionus plicatilis]
MKEKFNFLDDSRISQKCPHGKSNCLKITTINSFHCLEVFSVDIKSCGHDHHRMEPRPSRLVSFRSNKNFSNKIY